MKKDPWNTSKKATKRVKDPLPVPTKCNCCRDLETGEPTADCIEIVGHVEIYGKNYGKWPWVYRCDQCGAYVGMHPFTNIPLGTLADGLTRRARIECKATFEALYKNGRMSRTEAYARLSSSLGIDEASCHFAMFDIEQCELAASAAREIFLSA